VIILFKLMMMIGLVSFVLYLIENLRGRVTLHTQWSQLTRYQWCLVAGTVGSYVGFFGLILTRYFSK
jgi:hypothetical protein